MPSGELRDSANLRAAELTGDTDRIEAAKPELKVLDWIAALLGPRAAPTETGSVISKSGALSRECL